MPKAHLPELADLSDELGAEMFSVARRIAAALRRSAIRCEGVNLFYADGEVAYGRAATVVAISSMSFRVDVATQSAVR